jgi:hypothetical protein
MTQYGNEAQQQRMAAQQHDLIAQHQRFAAQLQQTIDVLHDAVARRPTQARRKRQPAVAPKRKEHPWHQQKATMSEATVPETSSETPVQQAAALAVKRSRRLKRRQNEKQKKLEKRQKQLPEGEAPNDNAGKDLSRSQHQREAPGPNQQTREQRKPKWERSKQKQEGKLIKKQLVGKEALRVVTGGGSRE